MEVGLIYFSELRDPPSFADYKIGVLRKVHCEVKHSIMLCSYLQVLLSIGLGV